MSPQVTPRSLLCSSESAPHINFSLTSFISYCSFSASISRPRQLDVGETGPSYSSTKWSLIFNCSIFKMSLVPLSSRSELPVGDAICAISSSISCASYKAYLIRVSVPALTLLISSSFIPPITLRRFSWLEAAIASIWAWDRVYTPTLFLRLYCKLVRFYFLSALISLLRYWIFGSLSAKSRQLGAFESTLTAQLGWFRFPNWSVPRAIFRKQSLNPGSSISGYSLAFNLLLISYFCTLKCESGT